MRPALILVAACASPGVPFVTRPVVEAPPVIEPLSPAIVFGPVGHLAAGYDEPASAPEDRASDALFEQLELGLGPGAVLARDPRLDLAAAEVAGVVAQGASPSDGLIEFALHAHGVVERGRALVARGATPELRMRMLAPQLGNALAYPNTRVGIGGGDELAVVILAYTVPVHVIALPREIHGGTMLAAVLSPPYEHPQITITHDDRSIDHLAAIEDGGGRFHAAVSCAGRTGRQWIAVSADHQTAPLAILPVSCNEPPPASYRVEPDANLLTTDARRRLLALIDRERVIAQLPPLRPDAAATAAAQAYAETMRTHRDAEHDLEATTPVTRLRAAGRIPLIVNETTIEADDLAHATEILLNDPLYRAQVVAPTATHIGLGLASTASELFVAIDYIQIVPHMDPVRLEQQAIDEILRAGGTLRLNSVRSRHPQFVVAPPVTDADLTRFARFYAANLALGWSPATVQRALKRDLQDSTVRYEAITEVVTEISDPKQIDASHTFRPGMVVDNLGVGVAQAPRDGPMCGRTWRVVIFGSYSARSPIARPDGRD